MTSQPAALTSLIVRTEGEEERANIVLTELVKAMGVYGDPAAIPAIERARGKYVRDIVCDSAIHRIGLLSSETKGAEN